MLNDVITLIATIFSFNFFVMFYYNQFRVTIYLFIYFSHGIIWLLLNDVSWPSECLNDDEGGLAQSEGIQQL